MVMAESLFTSYEVDNDKAFEKQIARALLEVNDLSDAFGEISRDFFRSQKAVFNNRPGLYPDYVDDKGRKGSESSYGKYKKKKYGRVYPMLVASGRLRDSLTEPTAPNKDTVLSIGKTTLVIGTSVESKDGYRYPALHQTGKGNMPLRKFLFIGPEASRYAPSSTTGRPERWKLILEKWVEAKLKRNQARS